MVISIHLSIVSFLLAIVYVYNNLIINTFMLIAVFHCPEECVMNILLHLSFICYTVLS